MGIFDLFKSDEERFSEEARKLASMARKCQEEGKYSDAAKYYEKAIGNNWYNPNYWNGYAWNKYLSNQVDDSVLEASSIACFLSKFQDHDIFDTKASILANVGLMKEALSAWNRAFTIMRAIGMNDVNIARRLYNMLSTVFISYEFNNIGQQLTDGIIENNANLDKKFNINTAKEFSMSCINEKVQEIIKRSFFLVAIITKKEQRGNGMFGISNWIISEIAIANSHNKVFILMVEEGVDIEELSCIRKNLEYIPFTHTSFAQASAKAIKSLIKKREELLLAVMG